MYYQINYRLVSVRYSTRIACLLCSFAVSSCSYCIDPSVKEIQIGCHGSLELATAVFKVSKSCHN